jgi:hypothetical protein
MSYQDLIADVVEPEFSATDGEAGRRRNRSRNWFLVALSTAVTGIILPLAYFQGEAFFSSPGAANQPAVPPSSYLIPYLTCLAGSLLFVMNTARAKGEEWDWGGYFGEHAYRVAQAFAYLFVVWWAWSNLLEDEVLTGTYLGPNVLGFLVGLFILRVERAMDGLGDKFEELLFALLPRAARYTVVEERKRQQVRAGYRLTDIATQWDVIRAQIGDEGAKASFDRELTAALELASSSDPEKARRAAEQIGRMFEEMKLAAGEILVPVEELMRS